jgi:hypothetical protein
MCQARSDVYSIYQRTQPCGWHAKRHIHIRQTVADVQGCAELLALLLTTYACCTIARCCVTYWQLDVCAVD